MLGWADDVLELVAELSAPTEKVVLMLYAAAANQEGVAWPSLAALARKSGYTRQAVYMARRSLAERGWLIPDGFATGPRGQRTPRFRVKGVYCPADTFSKRRRPSNPSGG
jgi:Helix-turn-helix domain